MKINKLKKRLLALLLCCSLVLGQNLLTMAEENGEDSAISTASEEPAEEKKEEPKEEKPVEQPKEEPKEEEPAEQPKEEAPAEDKDNSSQPSTEDEAPAEGEVVEGETTEEVEEEEETVVFDYKSSSVNVVVTLEDAEDFPEGAELSVEPIEISKALEEKIVEKAYFKDGIVISELKAFDIKFLLDGQTIQPGNTVKVAVSLPEVKMQEDAVVYHIDENNKLEDMDGELKKNDDVVFETTHFSDFVVATGDEINNGKFTGYGLLSGAARVKDGVLEYDKTAKVDNWDERTYDIEIDAKSILQEKSVTLSDGMLVVDMSGSMRYQGGYNSENVNIASYSRLGKFNDVVEELKSDKVYILSEKSGVSYSDEAVLYTLAYFNNDGSENDGWYYYAAGCAKDADASIPTVPGNYKPSLWKKVEGNEAAWYVYNWDSARLTQMKETVMKYMNTVAEKSPLSYFGISSYYHKGDLIHKYSPVVDGGNLNENVLKEFLAMRAQSQWCTYPHLGLEIAFKQMVSSSAYYDEASGKVVVPEGSYNSCYQRKVAGQTVGQYVVLFTDGYPDHLTGGTSADKELARLAKVWSDAFKAAGVKVYTVSFCVDNDTASFFEDVASEGCNKRGKNQSELESIFAEIRQSEQVTVADYVEVDVKDYINPRFEIVDAKGNKVENGSTYTSKGFDGKTGEYVTKTGRVGSDSNGQYIIWEDQQARKEGSSWTVKVKAKENYLGGNDVLTNIDNLSEIDAGQYGEYDLPDPTVNVKAALEIGDNNMVIYKGTAAPTAGETEEDPLTMLYNAEQLINKYASAGYSDVTRGMFDLQWYSDEEFTIPVELEDMASTRLNDEGNYYLKLTFTPNNSTETSKKNTDGHIAGNDDLKENGIVEAVNVNDNTKDYGTYNLKLWQIVKQGSPEEETVLKDAEFTLSSEDVVKYYGKSNEYGFVALYTDEECTELALEAPIGTYTFAETASPVGYILSTEEWNFTTSLATESSLANGVDNLESTFGDVEKEDAEGVVASYIFYNYRSVLDLPAAGGMGTTLFTAAGMGILILAAALTLIARRKREEA